MVGPMWDQLPAGHVPFLSGGMLKARLSHRAGVVRVLGSSGQGGTAPPARARGRGAWWSGGDLGEHGRAASSDVAASRRALTRLEDQPCRVGGGLRPSSTATLR